ncbi:Succinate dehydrogenase [Actinidia chinensis var. chinensis]|uniref:Succinate dehydrogenase n=1 Tax=Actinidia chinensis var. chinensis TaxID=1590841 RepID=A0A2R6R9J1_ACTCC|nr:Succinate dehydrogenase [Actinidia chinensis var. chinensis]
MIYRKWSLLTGPPAILGAIVATVVVANYLFVENGPFLKVEPRKQDANPSTK